MAVTRPSLPRSPRSIALWLLTAVVLWLAAAGTDRRTVVVVENLGDHLRFSVAGTELVVPDTIGSLDRVEIAAADSIDPPAALRVELEHDGRTVTIPAAAFHRLAGAAAPVGDWWVDHRRRLAKLVDADVALDGDFTLRAVLSGRFSSELAITLHGRPTVRLGLRRGLLDNYLVIRRSDDTLVDVTTLDPTPAADLGALAAQLLRAVAAGCLLVVGVGVLATAFAPGRRLESSDRSPRAAGLRHDRSRAASVAVVVGLTVLSTALSGWTSVHVLGGLPHQIDEVVYLLQARWLLDGEVAPAVSAIQPHLDVPFTYRVGDRWAGHYPVGWPALLALGLAVGAPHLINALLGGAFVVLLYGAGREIDGELAGVAAAVLGALSPLVRILGASMFPHLACAALVVAAVWAAVAADRRPGWRPGALVGLAMGACLAVRPMTAVAASVVLGGWLAARALSSRPSRARWSGLAAAIVGGLASSVPTLIHNAVVAGSPWSLPYSLTRGTMYGPGLAPFGLRNLDAIAVSASASLTGWGWPWLVGGLALALPGALLAAPFLLRRVRAGDWLLVATVLAVAIGHLPTRANGLHGFGARYAVDVAGCLFLLGGRGVAELTRAARPSRRAAAVVVGLFLALSLGTLVSLPDRLGLYRGYADVDGELERQLEAADIERAVILIDGDSLEAWCEAARIMTGPRRHDIVIAADLGDNSLVERLVPDLPVYVWADRRLEPLEGGPR